jgi:hypothetical protein
VPRAPDQAHDDCGLHFSERKQLREQVAAPAVFLAEGEHRPERQGDEGENDVLERQGHGLVPGEVPPAGDLVMRIFVSKEGLKGSTGTIALSVGADNRLVRRRSVRSAM